MKTKTLLITLTLVAMAPVARADAPDINITGEIRLGRRVPPPPPPVVVISPETHVVSSPWERGSWHQRSRPYYYYPGADVYYRSDDHLWFYQERGQWRSSRNLPDYVRVDFGRNIALTMYTDRPYTYHQQIVARYPSNYFGARVRLRDDWRDHDGRDSDHDGRDRDRNRRDNDHDGRDSDHDGRDRDRDPRR